MANKINKIYKFSVIVPVYNAEKHLRECITSVVTQSYSNFQLIVVNDGSTDNSQIILDEYAVKDSRIKIIHKQNQGPLLARVDAIKIADSDYCIFIDSDDLLSPCFFEPFIEELEVHDHDIFIYNYELMSSNGVTIKKAESLFTDRSVFVQENKIELYKEVVKAKLNSLWVKAIKTELMQKDPTNYSDFANVFFGEDLLLSLYPLTMAKSIKYIDLPLYKYRMNEDSICRTLNPKKLNSILTVYQEMYKYVPIWDRKGKLLNYFYLKTYGNTINSFFCTSVLQGSKLIKNTTHQIRMNDKVYSEYLNFRFTEEFGLTRKQKIIRLLFKYKLYFIIYLYFKMKRNVSIIAEKII